MSLACTNFIKGRPSALTRTTFFVRCYAKPRWVPIAKSKMFKNIELKYQPIHELEEKTRLKNNNRIYCRSLWAYQKQASEQLEDHSGTTVESNEDLEIRRIIRENEEINVRVKSQRDSALVEEWAQIVKEIEETKKLKENDDEQRLEIAKKKMLSEMEKLKSIINLDDLDAAIESALSSEVDYNFAIDKDGNVIRNTGSTSV